MYVAWDKGDGKSYSAFTNIWKKKEVSMYDYDENFKVINDLWMKREFEKIALDMKVISRYKKYLKDEAVIAAFKKNSSFFMRRAGDPIIFKREGVTGENVIDYIIMCGKLLDDADCKSDYYIPVAPHWFEDALDPL